MDVIIQALSAYKWVLICRILLTWLPDIDWYRQPFRLLRNLTDPVLTPFSRLIPPVGGIDFSPMLLFLVLEMLIKILK